MARVRPYYADGALSAAFYDEITAAIDMIFLGF